LLKNATCGPRATGFGHQAQILSIGEIRAILRPEARSPRPEAFFSNLLVLLAHFLTAIAGFDQTLV